jgi:methionyl-tRNA formyltransferase
MVVNIVIDNPNSWMNKKAEILSAKINEFCKEVHIISNPNKIKENSEATFFLSCESFITKKIREKSKFNIVIHASDLPKGKGMSPATWQILEGKNKIPVTLFEINDGYDEGDYYLKDAFDLNGTELISEWQDKLYKCTERMIIKFLKEKNNLSPQKQKGEETFYKKRDSKDSELNINKSVKAQFNKLRIVDNEKYPTFFNYKGEKYILKIYKNKK